MSCPRGDLCLDRNMFLLIAVVSIIFVIYVFYNQSTFYTRLFRKQHSSLKRLEHNQIVTDKIYNRAKNPLVAPTRDYPGIGINIPTRGYIPHYQQVGALLPESGTSNTVLPLYGKPTYPGSNKWNYYTSTDQFNSVKLPVTKDGKDCQYEFGCEEIEGNADVSVPGHSGSFNVNLYNLDKPRYIPYIH